MSVNETIGNIVRLPRNFRKHSDVSINSLVQNTGYSEVRDQITLEAIREALHADTELLEEWLDYSESSRASTGWYMIRRQEDFQIGYYAGHGRELGIEIHRDGLTACASFIQKELEDIRSSQQLK